MCSRGDAVKTSSMQTNNNLSDFRIGWNIIIYFMVFVFQNCSYFVGMSPEIKNGYVLWYKSK